jgi:uncharacterized coiled-coil DUF342 family protein
MSTPTVSVDEFQALEQRVMRTVELIKQEREKRASAEAQVKQLREELEMTSEEVSSLSVELAGLKQERESVKSRVDTMLQQLDELL